jgi:hypothetical protein
MPRALPIAVAVAIALAWGGVGVLTMSRSDDKPGNQHLNAGEVKDGLRSIRGEVLGKNTQVRGDKVVGNVVKAQDESFNYSPREVCVKMKLDFPDKYQNLDCSKPEYDSPHDWNDVNP